jgi:hypothetical protein
MRHWAHSHAPVTPRPRARLEGWRRALGLVAAVGLAVPSPAIGVAACAIGVSGADCPRCEAMRPPEPAPPSEALPACHGAAAAAPAAAPAASGGCHPAGRSGDCCRYQADAPAAPPQAAGLSAPLASQRLDAVPGEASVGAPALAAARPRPSESPPGLRPTLRTQTTILRL